MKYGYWCTTLIIALLCAGGAAVAQTQNNRILLDRQAPLVLEEPNGPAPFSLLAADPVDTTLEVATYGRFIRNLGGCNNATSYADWSSLPAFLQLTTREVYGQNGNIITDFEIAADASAPPGGPYTGMIGYRVFRGSVLCQDDTILVSVTIVPAQAPQAHFDADIRDGLSGMSVQFSDLSSHGITTRTWNFGDGNSSAERDPVHVYNAPGIYAVSLSVSGPAGSDNRTENGFIRVYDCGGGQVFWTGNGDGFHWDDPQNWCTGSVPGPGDAVFIIFDRLVSPNGQYDIAMQSPASIASLTIGARRGEQILNIAGGSLSISGDFSVGDSAIVTLSGGSLDVQGIYVLDGAFLWEGGNLSGVRLDCSGRLVANGTGTKSFEGWDLNFTDQAYLEMRQGVLVLPDQAELRGLFLWRGGALSCTGSVSVMDSLRIQLRTSNDPFFLDRTHLLCKGETAWNQGDITLTNGGIFENAPTGSLEVWNRSKMLTSDNGEMVNRGNLRKSRYYANAPTEISVPFTNTGTVQLDTMELQIKAGSLWQGNLVVNSGAWLTFSGTESHTFEASANLGGEGWLVLNGEVQQFGTSMTLTNRMEIQRGRTEVSGNLTLPHLSLRGGILAVSGTTTVQDSLNIRILNSARPIVLDGGRLVNLGTGFWNNGDITLGSGAILENAGSGTLDIYNRSDMIPGSGGGSFINRGLITRTRYFANDATGIQVPFTNTGTVRLDTTGLELAVGSTYQGQFEVKPGAWLTLRGDTHTFDVGSTLAGGGVLVFDADGQLLNGNLDLRGQLELRRGVTVRNGDLPVNGFLNFRGGTLRVSGVTSVSDSISFREANSSRPMVIDGGRLLNNSVAYWNSGDITLANGAILDNPAGSVVDIYNRSEILAINGGEFRNAGLIKKERFFHADPSVITARLVNTGMVRVDTSGLNLSYGGSYGGNFEINNGGWLRLFGDQTHTFAVGSTVRGTGTLVLEAAEHHMDGDLLLAGTLELRSGRTLINRDLTLPRLTHRGGALTVSGTLSISDSLSFYYRNSNNPVIIDGGRLLNLRYATWNPGDINLINNAVLENAAGATLDIFTRWDMEGGGAGQFINRGLVKVDRFFEDTPATVRVPFTNLGTVQLDTSGLAFAVSSLNQGEYRINPGGNLYFVGADTHYFAIGSQVGGSGRLSLGAAGHFFEGDLDLNGWIEQRNGLTTYGSDWPMRKLHFRGGVLRIGGRITVADTLVLERLATNVNLALDGCRLVNNGAGEWLPADIVLANGAVLENGATGSLDIFTERRISEVNGGLFENHGLITMNRFYSAVQPRVMVPFLNTGTVRLDSTGFKLLATSSSSGIYDVSGTAILTFGGSGTHRFESGSHLGGTGIVELAADNHLLEGNLDLRGNLVVRWGVTERSGSLETAELTFLGGTVRVADTLQVNDSLYIAATAGPDIIMDGGRLLSNGYGVWESGHLDLANAAVLEIGESGVFDLNSSGNIEPHTGSFILNRGLLRRLPDLASQGINLPVENTGELQVDGNALNLNRTLLNTGRVTGTGNLVISPANLIHNGVFGPGNPLGILTLTGNYDNAAGALEIELRDHSGAGSGNDYLQVSGSAALGGELRVRLNSGFMPLPGDTFAIMGAPGGISDTFMTVLGPSGYTLEMVYRSNEILLAIGDPPAPELYAPADGAITDTALTLVWQRVPGVLSYHLQVAADAGFTTLLSDSSGIADTTWQLVGLTRDRTHYWRVSSLDLGGESVFSQAFHFTTQVALPAVPVLRSPANLAVDVPTSPGFSWRSAPGARSYRFQLSALADFSVLLADSAGISDTTFTVSGLDLNSLYYWRVKARNAAGESAFSGAWQFTTSDFPAPALIAPLNGASGLSPVVQLTWSAIPQADAYQLQVAGKEDFSNLLVNAPAVADTVFLLENLRNDSTYFWRVQAIGSGRQSGFTGTRHFTVRSLGRPALLAPLDGASERPLSDTLRWASLSDAEDYRIQMAVDEQFNTLLMDQTTADTLLLTPQLQVNTTYFWRVAGQRDGISGDFGEVFSFTTVLSSEVNPPPVIPERFYLGQNYPNPFNPSTTIPFDLPEDSEVSLAVYNILGEQVAVVVSGRLPAGRYQQRWEPRNTVPSGIYFVRMTAGQYSRTLRLMLLK